MKTKSLKLSEAENKMRTGSVLRLLHSYGRGLQYYLVPGGHVERKDAEKIIARPDVISMNDGLFPDSPQSWKMGGGGVSVAEVYEASPVKRRRADQREPGAAL
jgi:hypothetical protein